METLSLSSQTSVAMPAQPARPVAGPLEAAVDEQVIGGRVWTVRLDAAEWLASVKPEAWARPDGQPGWERVKQNAAREVWRARIQGRPVYLKYYAADRLIDRLKEALRGPTCVKEWNAGVFALQAGIPAARPVAWSGDVTLPRGRHSLLITEALVDAEPLNEFWLRVQRDTSVVRRRHDVAALADLLGELLARAHQAGFEHLDMHAANILIQTVGVNRYRAVFVDLQSVALNRPLTDRAVVRNLAQLNQWFRRHSSVKDRLRFARAYFRWRNEFETVYAHGRALGQRYPELVAGLVNSAARHASRLWSKRDRRSQRHGRYFLRLRWPGGWQAVALRASKHPGEESLASKLAFAPEWWQKILLDPALHSGTSAKDSHSATVSRVTLPHPDRPLPVIVKRPRSRNWRRRLRGLLPRSRSQRGWRIGHALLNRDVPTARPLACVERRFGPLVLDSWLLTEALPNAVDLETFLQRERSQCSARQWQALKGRLGEQLVRHVRHLHERGFVHRDCKASNVLVLGDARKLLWIDLDGIRRAGGRLRRIDEVRALARLHVSLLGVAGVTRGDRVRFLRAYTARFGASPDAWRELWRAIEPRVGAKLQSRERRLAWKRANYGRE